MSRPLGQQPLRFEENQGQGPSAARFVARRGGMALYLENEGATLAVSKPGAPYTKAVAQWESLETFLESRLRQE